MPRYFLNMEHFDGDVVFDENGSEYADLHAAIQEARLAIIELIYEAMRDETARAPLRIVLLDDAGVQAGDITAQAVLPAQLQE